MFLLTDASLSGQRIFSSNRQAFHDPTVNERFLPSRCVAVDVTEAEQRSVAGIRQAAEICNPTYGSAPSTPYLQSPAWEWDRARDDLSSLPPFQLTSKICCMCVCVWCVCLMCVSTLSVLAPPPPHLLSPPSLVLLLIPPLPPIIVPPPTTPPPSRLLFVWQHHIWEELTDLSDFVTGECRHAPWFLPTLSAAWITAFRKSNPVTASNLYWEKAEQGHNFHAPRYTIAQSCRSAEREKSFIDLLQHLDSWHISENGALYRTVYSSYADVYSHWTVM